MNTLEGHPRTGLAEGRQGAEDALARCRGLYAQGRSADAIPIARAALERAREVGDPKLVHRALTACGALSADTFDVVSGIEFHLESLRLGEKEGDQIEVSGSWSNIGAALALAGSAAMAIRAYGRALDAVEGMPGAHYERFAALCNRANSFFQLADHESGLRDALLALPELTPEVIARDRHAAVLARRNVVHLMVATGRAREAAGHVEELAKLAAETTSPRAFIAYATARAAFELATGRSDVALTRLDQALAKARETPSALRETLVCIVRAEELVGSPERALTRLDELSRHVYDTAIERARRHVELANLGGGLTFAEHASMQAQARLQSGLAPPDAPAGWEALRRLAVTASLRLDSNGWHGVRVGALTKALALACGEPPLRALEISLAAELHDIGMLSVPEAILARRGAIRDCEFDAYYRHTVAGGDILRDDSHPRHLVARDVALYHHARWDGTGYPDRVGGKFIPLAARMCAVADTYDELVCGFRAAKGMTMGSALKALRSKAGSQLDPELVERFATMVSEGVEDHGIDPALGSSLEGFQALIDSLEQDRGYV